MGDPECHGRKSKAKLEQFYGEDPILSKRDYLAFTRRWPHMDDLPEWERPQYVFTGYRNLPDYDYCD